MHKITTDLGDCLEVMRSLPDNSVDMVLCDLPYGSTNCKWDVIIPFDALWKAYARIVKSGCAIVLFGNEPFASHLRLSNLKQFRYDWIWKKSKSGSAFTAKYKPVNKHETICVFGEGTLLYNPQFTEGKPYTRTHKVSEVEINNHRLGFNRKEVQSVNDGFRHPITIQEFQQKWRRQDQLHPTQKPVELCEYLIKTYTLEGQTVLDNCMGSGTTGVACVNTNRSFIGIEKDPDYFKLASERITKQAAGNPNYAAKRPLKLPLGIKATMPQKKQ